MAEKKTEKARKEGSRKGGARAEKFVVVVAAEAAGSKRKCSKTDKLEGFASVGRHGNEKIKKKMGQFCLFEKIMHTIFFQIVIFLYFLAYYSFCCVMKSNIVVVFVKNAILGQKDFKKNQK